MIRNLLLALCLTVMLGACGTTPATDDQLSGAVKNQKQSSLMHEDHDWGQKLDTAQINKLFLGKEIRGTLSDGRDFLAEIHRDHKISIHFLQFQAHDPWDDSGNWWADKNQYCQRFNTFKEHQIICYDVVRTKQGIVLENADQQDIIHIALGPDIEDVSNVGNSLLAKFLLSYKETYNIGTYVGYSEACAQWRGSGADNKVLSNIKDTFSGSKAFKKGYDLFGTVEGADRVSGLYDCEEVRKALEKLDKHLRQNLN